ncbi:hypothetical protein BH09MYX1_BH09MYX1_27200 [soil metagenome]
MSLSSLIVQRELATIRQVEEALARQVLYGGDLLTNLLEVTAVDEWQVATLAAEDARIPVAPSGALKIPSKDVLDHIPSELALRRGMFPLSVEADRILLAVAEPLAKEEEEQLAFALGMRIEQVYALFVRVRQALAAAYGAPLDRRLDALLLRLNGQDARLPSSRPPLLQNAPIVTQPPRPASVPPYRLSPAYGIPATPAFVPDTDETPAPSIEMPPPTPLRSRTTTEAGFPAPRLEPVTDGPAHPLTIPPPTARTTGAYVSPTVVAPPPAPTFVQATANSTRPVRRRRGPLSVKGAQEEMKGAEDRDAILDLIFEFGRQFFDFAALFVVHGDVAEGRDAFGAGATRETVVGIGVPLSQSGMLARARDAKAPVYTRITEDSDVILRSDLERGADTEIVVLPVLVRGRAVALFVGDGGDEGIDRSAIHEVLELTKAAGSAFERIIMRKKLGGFSAAPSGGPLSGKADLSEIPLPIKSTPPRTSRDTAARANALGRALLGGASASQPPKAPSEPPGLPLGDTPNVRPKLELAADPPIDAAPPRPQPIDAQPVFPLNNPLRKLSSKPPPPEIAVRSLDRPTIPREEPTDPAVAAHEPTIDDEPIIESAPSLETGSLDDAEERALLEELRGMEDQADQEELEEPEEEFGPASQAMAVGPRLPPAAYKLESLPSIMIDMDQELLLVIDRIVAGKDDNGHGEGELLRQGRNAMPALMSRFPGPLAISRNELVEPYPKPRDCGPLLRLIAAQRRVALPYVVEEMRSGDSARRFWATFLLTELAYAEAVPALVARFHDADPKVRAVARAAARALGDDAREALLAECARTLRDTRGSRSVRLGVIDALADLREGAAVQLLARQLTDTDSEVQMAARRALIAITKQDFALDEKHWLSWWGEHSTKHRVEWLIDALEGDTPALRKAAADELKILTRQTFGYYEDLPKRDRERIQQRYRDWWYSEGRSRFQV